MKTLKRTLVGLAALLGALTLAQPQAQAVIVDLELALVIDMSGSVDQSEFELQRDGYQAAFNSAGVQAAIQALGDAGTGGIAVSVFYFSTNTTGVNGLQIGWTQLDSAADAAAFALDIAGLTETDPASGGIGRTNIAAGIDTAQSSIGSNGFEGARKVIDVSSDGVQNTTLAGTSVSNTDGIPIVQAARNAAEAAGITVNGLAIDPGVTFNGLTLLDYFNAFVITSDGFASGTSFDTAVFAAAVEDKIFREITGIPVPEPSSLLLFALGLLGLGVMTRRRRVV